MALLWIVSWLKDCVSRQHCPFCFVPVRNNSLRKACLQRKAHLGYPASLQALHSNTYKQIIQIQHNRIKYPKWQERTSWLFTRVSESSERDLNPGPPDCESRRRTDHLPRLPHVSVSVSGSAEITSK